MADVPRRFDLNDPKIKYSNIAPERFDLSDSSLQVMALPENVSGIESALRGGAQGLTFGFADELSGLGESAVTDKTYEQARDESRTNFDRAYESNPGAYIAGNVGGAILPAILSAGTSTVGSAASTAGLIGNVGAKTLLGMAGQGALQGGLQGLGESEGKSAGDIAKDVAMGAGLGAVSGGVLGGLSRGGSKLVDALPSGQVVKEGLENRIIGSTTGLTDEGVDVLRKTPDALRRVEALGEGTTQDVILRKAAEVEKFLENNPIKSRLDNNYKQAMGLLDNSREVVSTNPINDVIQNKIDKLDVGGQKAFGESAQSTQAYLENFRDQINKAFPDGQLDAPNAKRVIDQIRADIKKYGGFMNPQANDDIGNTLKEVQRALDQQLKGKVPGYSDIMKEVQKDTILNQRLTKSFFQKNEGIDINKIKNMIKNQSSNNPNLRDQKVISKLSNAMQEFDGPNLTSTIDDIKLKKLIESRSNQGSNLVNYGTAMGTAIGAGVGGMIGGTEGAAIGGALGGGSGTLAGKRLETTARKAASSYFQNQAERAPDIIRRVSGTKYAPVLQSAAQKGTRNFAVANYLLQQQDENYRNLIEEK